jgi:hypothetical protein
MAMLGLLGMAILVIWVVWYFNHEEVGMSSGDSMGVDDKLKDLNQRVRMLECPHTEVHKFEEWCGDSATEQCPSCGMVIRRWDFDCRNTTPAVYRKSRLPFLRDKKEYYLYLSYVIDAEIKTVESE